FADLVEEGRRLPAEIPALKVDSAAERLPIDYQLLVGTICAEFKIPHEAISLDDIRHGLYLLSKAYGGPVELDSASCKSAGVDLEVLAEDIRLAQRERGRNDEANTFLNAYMHHLQQRAQAASQANPPAELPNPPTTTETAQAKGSRKPAKKRKVRSQSISEAGITLQDL